MPYISSIDVDNSQIHPLPPPQQTQASVFRKQVRNAVHLAEKPEGKGPQNHAIGSDRIAKIQNLTAKVLRSLVQGHQRQFLGY